MRKPDQALGFVFSELVISIGVGLLAFMSVVAVGSVVLEQRRGLQTKIALREIQNELYMELNSEGVAAAIRALPENAQALDCLINQTPCAQRWQRIRLAIPRESSSGAAAGYREPAYIRGSNGNLNAGFSQTGAPCTGFDLSAPNPNCPYQILTEWAPICSQSPCINPAMSVRARIIDSFNVENGDVNLASLMVKVNYLPPPRPPGLCSDPPGFSIGGGGAGCNALYPPYTGPMVSSCGGYTRTLFRNPQSGFVYLFSVYETTGDSHGPSATPPRQLARQMTVQVPSTHAPNSIVLVLTSYEPAIWRISGNVGAVMRVYATGYHCQDVEGINPTLVRRSSYDRGQFNYFVWGGENISSHQAGTFIRGITCSDSAIQKADFWYTGQCFNWEFVAD